jgi:hypothetical protein
MQIISLYWEAIVLRIAGFSRYNGSTYPMIEFLDAELESPGSPLYSKAAVLVDLMIADGGNVLLRDYEESGNICLTG